MNGFLTAYLRALNVLSGGGMSPSRAMDRLIDFISAAQGAKTSMGKLLKFEGREFVSVGRRHFGDAWQAGRKADEDEAKGDLLIDRL